MRRPVAVIVASALLGTGAAIVPAAAEEGISPSPSAEQTSFARVNDERTERGKRALRWHTKAASIARAHSEDMAEDGELRHNERLPDQIDGWRSLGENVGMGPSAGAIHQAFMGSSPHRANILGSFTHVGIGAVVDPDGTVWITQVFLTPESSPSGGGSDGSSGGTSRVRSERRRADTTTSAPAQRRPARRARARSVAAQLVAEPRPVRTAPALPDPTATRTLAVLERFADETPMGNAAVGCIGRRLC